MDTNQTEAYVRFNEVQKSYDGEELVIKNLNLDIDRGEFLTMLGPSGSGKTTCLMMLAGFEPATHGEIFLGERPINAVPPHKRGIGMAFQNYALFPHMTVGENIAIGPRLVGEKLEDGRIAQLLKLVDLEGAMAARMPDELSGGQRQRVGVARALANEPQLLLMDEPFGALDPITRDALGERVRSLHSEFGLTTVMVTHDMAEALLLADRVLVMDGGAIVADETPHSLLEGAGGEIAQGLVAVPRAQADRLAELAR